MTAQIEPNDNDTSSAAAARMAQDEQAKQLRDLRVDFAKAALSGYIASFAGVPQTRLTPADVASQSFEFADAMMAEMGKRTQS